MPRVLTPQQLGNSEDQGFFFPENWLVSTDHHTANGPI